MAATPSTMLELGTPAPPFSLPDTDGRTVSLADYDGAPALLVMFICNHCPYVKHLRAALAELGREYGARGVGIVAVSANDAERHPADSPEMMRREKQEAGSRDYFRVEDAEGRRYWLYREGLYGAAEASPRWYLQGFSA